MDTLDLLLGNGPLLTATLTLHLTQTYLRRMQQQRRGVPRESGLHSSNSSSSGINQTLNGTSSVDSGDRVITVCIWGMILQHATRRQAVRNPLSSLTGYDAGQKILAIDTRLGKLTHC